MSKVCTVFKAAILHKDFANQEYVNWQRVFLILPFFSLFWWLFCSTGLGARGSFGSLSVSKIRSCQCRRRAACSSIQLSSLLNLGMVELCGENTALAI